MKRTAGRRRKIAIVWFEASSRSHKIRIAAGWAAIRLFKSVLILFFDPLAGDLLLARLQADEINALLQVLNRLVDAGNSVVIIEHNMDVVKTADWIIDLGPEGGDGGGRIVAAGTPAQVAKNLYPFERVDVGVEVPHLHAKLLILRRQVFGHALGEGGD